jgi:hypothetical protein
MLGRGKLLIQGRDNLRRPDGFMGSAAVMYVPGCPLPCFIALGNGSRSERGAAWIFAEGSRP